MWGISEMVGQCAAGLSSAQVCAAAQMAHRGGYVRLWMQPTRILKEHTRARMSMSICMISWVMGNMSEFP